MPARRYVVTGASGLVGKALVQALLERGNEVVVLVRRAPRDPHERNWDPVNGLLDPAVFEGAQGVIHLAGTPVAAQRWSETQKGLIRDSRVLGTATLIDALSRCEVRPEVLLSASAVGIYGANAGDSLKAETDAAGQDFLAEVCTSWEAEAQKAETLGMRVVRARFGHVLSGKGGLLQRLVRPFKAGLGGRFGNGLQWMSWIHHQDLTHLLLMALDQPHISGALNCVSPAPVRQSEFASQLARHLQRPALAHLPKFAVKALFGEMGESLLLGGQRVSADKLRAIGFRFNYPELAPALEQLLPK